MKRRLAVLVVAAAASACNPPAPESAPPPPAAVPAPDPWRTGVVDHPPHYTPDRDLRVCVVEGEGLKEVPIRFSDVTGDSTTLDGRPFHEAYPADGRYAASHRFFVDNEVVPLFGRRYPKYGLPRVLGIDEVERAGEYRGVGIYIEKGSGMPAHVYYLPVRPGCLFQTYQIDYVTGGVRG